MRAWVFAIFCVSAISDYLACNLYHAHLFIMCPFRHCKFRIFQMHNFEMTAHQQWCSVILRYHLWWLTLDHAPTHVTDGSQLTFSLLSVPDDMFSHCSSIQNYILFLFTPQNSLLSPTQNLGNVTTDQQYDRCMNTKYVSGNIYVSRLPPKHINWGAFWIICHSGMGPYVMRPKNVWATAF